MHDVIVAGAGPAGIATALYAARAGLDVVVIDPRQGAIDKACGEGVMPGGVRALSDLQIPLPGKEIHGIRYLHGRRSAEAVFPASPGRGVRRTDLHTALTCAASSAGIQILAEQVKTVRQDTDHVYAAGLKGRYLVAADGLHSPLRRSLGLDVSVSARHRRWGLRQHFPIQPWSDFVEVHWGATSEAYVTPVGDNLVGVAILTTTRSNFDEQLASFPALRERLPEATTTVRGAGPLRQKSRNRVSGRVLLVGDAAGYVDALTGEGITVALKSAKALVDSLVADSPQDYERSWAAASRSYRAVTSSLLWTSRQRLIRPAIVPAAAAAPCLFRAAVRQLAQ